MFILVHDHHISNDLFCFAFKKNEKHLVSNLVTS